MVGEKSMVVALGQHSHKFLTSDNVSFEGINVEQYVKKYHISTDPNEMNSLNDLRTVFLSIKLDRYMTGQNEGTTIDLVGDVPEPQSVQLFSKQNKRWRKRTGKNLDEHVKKMIDNDINATVRTGEQLAIQARGNLVQIFSNDGLESLEVRQDGSLPNQRLVPGFPRSEGKR